MERLATGGVRRGCLRVPEERKKKGGGGEGKTFEKGQASVFACMNCVALSLQRVSGSGCRHLSSSSSFFFFWMCYRSRAIGLC